MLCGPGQKAGRNDVSKCHCQFQSFLMSIFAVRFPQVAQVRGRVRVAWRASTLDMAAARHFQPCVNKDMPPAICVQAARTIRTNLRTVAGRLATALFAIEFVHQESKPVTRV